MIVAPSTPIIVLVRIVQLFTLEDSNAAPSNGKEPGASKIVCAAIPAKKNPGGFPPGFFGRSRDRT
jgi:hypothetical protein